MTSTDTSDAPQHADPAAAAVIVLGEGFDLQHCAPALRDLVDSIDPRRHLPSVLVTADLQEHPVLDDLRLTGVSVMVQRPLDIGNGLAGSTRRLLELVSWLRSADARTVFVPSDDQRLVRAVGVARRFARGVGEVIQITLRPAASGGGKKGGRDATDRV